MKWYRKDINAWVLIGASLVLILLGGGILGILLAGFGLVNLRRKK